MIGEGEDRAELEARADALGLRETVRFLGARPDAASLMRMIDLLVVPSLMETTPFVVLEAMSASRPVVASRIFGIPEIVVGRRLAAFSFVRTIRRISPGRCSRCIEDRTKREEMGVAGRKRYESLFTAERMARKTEAAYLGDDLPAAAGAVVAVEGAGGPSSGDSKGRAS